MPTPTTKPLEPTAPYPGLRPFQPHEASIFFGRDEHVADMLTVLEDHRFLAVVGPSGAGKSSLVLAGLLPALQDGMLLTARSRDWRMIVLRPGDRPFRHLAEAARDGLFPSATAGGNPQFHDGDAGLTEIVLRENPFGLVQTVFDAALPDKTNVLVVVDQFEELFRFRSLDVAAVPGAEAAERRNDAAAFVQLLMETARQSRHPIHVMLTMRSDYLGECDMFEGLPQAINESQFLTPRLTFRQLEQAITGPLQLPQFRGRVHPDLVQRIQNDMGQDRDQLPVVQHALFRTWQFAKHRAAKGNVDLTLVDYEKIGGIHEALSRHADEALEELKRRDLTRVVQRVFRGLCTLGPTGQRIRRPQRIDTLAAESGATPEQVAQVVQAFAKPGRSFLVAAVRDGQFHKDSTVDISHESLIRQWKSLVDPAHPGAGWIEKEEAAARRWRRLVESARLDQERSARIDREFRASVTVDSLGEMIRSERDTKMRDPELQRMLDWWQEDHPTSAWADRYEPGTFESVCRFLKDSEQERERQRERDAALIEEREAAKLREQELKYERDQAATERKSKRRFQAMSALAAAIAVIALGMFAWAMWQAGVSVRATLAARAAEREAKAAVIKESEATAEAKKEKAKADEATKKALTAQTYAEAQAAVIELEKKNAEYERSVANVERSVANVERLAALSSMSAGRSRERQLLLAVEAVQQAEQLGLNVTSAKQALLDAVSPRELGGNRGTIQDVFVSMDGRQIIAADSSDQFTFAIGYGPGTPPRTSFIQPMKQMRLPMAVSRSRDKIVMNGHDQTIELRVFGAPGSASIPLLPREALEHRQALDSLAIGNQLAASGYRNGSVQLHDLSTQRSLPFAQLGDSITGLALSPNDQWLAATTRAGELAVFSVSDPTKPSIAWPPGSALLGILSFTSNSRWLVFGDGNHELRAWPASVEVRAAEAIRLTGPGRSTEITSLTTSNSADWLAVGWKNGVVQLWNAADGLRPEPSATILGHNGAVLDLAFDAADTRLVSVGEDRTLRIVELASPMSPSLVLRDQVAAADPIVCAAVLSDRIVTGGTRLLSWDLDSKRLIETAGKTAKRNLSASEWSQFFPGREYAPTFPQLPIPHEIADRSDKSIRYFIESLPKIADAEKLVDKAWQSWQMVAYVDGKRVPRREDANVILQAVPSDVFSDFGDASLGPPDDLQLNIRFDQDHEWDARRFQATACHCFGHILGLDHSAKSDQLMLAALPDGVTSPQPEDIERLQKRVGVAKQSIMVAASAYEQLESLAEVLQSSRAVSDDLTSGQIGDALHFLSDANLLKTVDPHGRDALYASQLAITQFQKLAGVPSNGKLDPDSLARMQQFRVCRSTRAANSKVIDLDPNSQAAHYNQKSGGRVLFVFVDRLPAILDPMKADETVELAFRSWEKTIRFTYRRVERREDANVVVTTLSGHGPVKILGRCDVGGPDALKSRQLILELDEHGLDSPELVQVALMHHVGHILGLEHSSTTDQLMNALLDTTRKSSGPGREDSERLLDIWGLGRMQRARE